MKTGTYKYNPEIGEVEKVSDSIPCLKSNVWFPGKGNFHSGIKFENLNKTFYSRNEKRQYMKSKNIAEAG